MTESEWISIRMFLVKVTLKIGEEKYLLPILFWKLILGLMKLKIYTKKKKKKMNFLLKINVVEYIINQLLFTTK